MEPSLSSTADPLVQALQFNPISAEAVLLLISLLALLFLSAVISGGEVALFSLSQSDSARLSEKYPRTNRLVETLLERPERLFASIRVISIMLNVLFVVLFFTLYHLLVAQRSWTTAANVVVVFIAMFVVLFAGEIIPKILASARSVGFARFAVYPVWILEKVFKPLVSLFEVSPANISKRLVQRRNISIDELSDAIEMSSGQHPEDRKILKGIIAFGNTEVREIMKARLDVVAVDVETGFDKLKSIVVESGYSRIPVYDETFDDVKGILYVKDLLPHIEKADTFNWQELMRKPYYVPESKKISDLLAEFQSQRIHLAIVVDEYGGTCGIVTLEDILEEIVGEISDESDEDVALYSKIDEANYLFEGKILLNDFCKVVNCDDEIFDDVRGDAETLAGLILEITGQIPPKNAVVSHKQFSFKIDAVDNRRIRKVKVTIDRQN
ncbi:MAG: gliding motility-associated protein GldE [Bacteroidales bacterium]|nr:gliding motility-associated protein GldE [Bacteroidales bacterium]MBN2750438.1 gliding motility-associated protein GldE [Bacteroidales bacterium]